MPAQAQQWENRLARQIQKDVPLVPRPFAAIAAELDLAESRIIDRLRAWIEGGRLREISAVLEGKAFEHDSAVVTGRVPEHRIETVAAIINQHPAVTHNYRRDHEYNLWFTISVPPHQSMEETLQILARLTDVEAYHPLRYTMIFKLGVNFDLVSRRNTTPPAVLCTPDPHWPTEREQRLYRLLQTPLPLCERPFARLVAHTDVDEQELLEFGRRRLGNSIRRYVGTFLHRRIGVHGNGMAVWRVDEERLPQVGRAFSQIPEVSHCYARNTIAGFPYNFYAMLHGPDRQSIVELATRLTDANGLSDPLLLFSTHEYKKCRLRYFQPELDAWWERHAGAERQSAPPSCARRPAVDN